MKALVLQSPGELTYEPSWKDPEPPEGWVLVRVRASGICGSDLGRVMKTAAQRPTIPGHEFAGVVVHSSSGSQAGDRVAVVPIIPCGSCPGCRLGPFHCENYDFIGSRRDGGFAEFCAVPKENLFKLPDNVSYEEGAFIEPLSIALHAARRAGVQPGARVLVLGAGAIGTLTAQWSMVLGASEVVLADIRDQSLAIARASGVERTVNPLSDEFESIGHFDHVVEAAGSNAALLNGIEKAALRGTLTVIGRDVKQTAIPRASFEKLMRKELDLRGCWGSDTLGEAEFIYECLNARKFIFDPMITQRIPLEDGPETIKRMWNKDIFYCKVLFAVE